MNVSKYVSWFFRHITYAVALLVSTGIIHAYAHAIIKFLTVYITWKGVDKRRTDKTRTADGGAFYKHMITTATNYNTLN